MLLKHFWSTKHKLMKLQHCLKNRLHWYRSTYNSLTTGALDKRNWARSLRVISFQQRLKLTSDAFAELQLNSNICCTLFSRLSDRGVKFIQQVNTILKMVAGQNIQIKLPKPKMPKPKIHKLPRFPNPKYPKPKYPKSQNTQDWNSHSN